MAPLGDDFSAAEEATALLLVCRGLEAVCLEALAWEFPGCRCRILPGGGEDGEASVGKVLLALPAGTESEAALAAAWRSPAVQGAFAYLAGASGMEASEAGLAALSAAVEASPRWDAAVRLWRAARQAAAPPGFFRASAVRDGKHQFSTMDVARKVGAAAMRRTGWRVNLEDYDTEVFTVVSNDVAVVGLPLFPEWRGAASGLSERPERFFVLPREVRDYLCPDAHTSNGVMRLRPSTCYLMLRLAGVGAGMHVLDPMGGVGTIAIESAVRWPHVKALSSDLSGDATRAALANTERAAQRLATGATVCVEQADVKALGLDEASIDAVVTDVPFGNRNRSANVTGLLPVLLAGLARWLRPGGRAVLLMTRAHARQMAADVQDGGAQNDSGLLELVDSLKVIVGGWPAAILVLRRSSAPRSAAAAAAAGEAELPEGGEPTECVLEMPGVPGRQLSDFVQKVWAGHFPTESAARKATSRGRVWLLDGGGLARKPWWNEKLAPGSTILYLPDHPRRAPYEESLVVLYETEELAVVMKKPGLRLFGGIRTLANILAAGEHRSLRPSRRGDGLPAAAPVHYLQAEACGAVLVAKTAPAAAALSRRPPRRRLRAVLHGDATALGLRTPRQLQHWIVHRLAPSLRFGHITEAALDWEGDVAGFRRLCADMGHVILGDTCFGGDDAPVVRRNCVYLSVSAVHFRDAAGAEVTVTCRRSPERFDKLFAGEAVAFNSAMAGRFTSEYVRQLKKTWDEQNRQQQQEEQLQQHLDRLDREENASPRSLWSCCFRDKEASAGQGSPPWYAATWTSTGEHDPVTCRREAPSRG